jgi:hypothetical protein
MLLFLSTYASHYYPYAANQLIHMQLLVFIPLIQHQQSLADSLDQGISFNEFPCIPTQVLFKFLDTTTHSL